ncbi:Annexin-like protein RJ4 [Morella rubra]|uniref:Annexin n=1 Tax=Morella rubra TaxID=262757 RepID=A0A6A1UH29_9ROSI|nr:Annexin-like protein RJ4 [Morella rubra]
MATLITPDHFSPVEDAEALQKACKGWGTNEKAVISVLGHRNAVQRKQIRQAYEDLYQEDLIKRLESELSGDLEKAVYRWILDPFDRDAVLANVALRKAETNYHVIIEISCIHCPEELLGLLVGLVSAYRYDGQELNERQAKTEADILHHAIKDKESDYEEVIRILTTRSKTQLIASFNRYRDEHGTSITKNMLGDKRNEIQKALRTVIRCISDPKKYYEKVLRNAIKGVGSDEDALIRVIVTRAERDLRDIKELYLQRNSVSLDHAVAKETSGDYKAFLLTLLGKED